MENLNKRIFFSLEDDLHLAREVVGHNPYEDTGRWNLIQMNIMQITGKFIAVRTMRDRVKKLAVKFVEKDKLFSYKSGTEEEVDELDDLLRHIVDLIKEFKGGKKKSGTENSYLKGLQQRETATHLLQNYVEDATIINKTIYESIENDLEPVEQVSLSNLSVAHEIECGKREISTPHQICSNINNDKLEQNKNLNTKTPTAKTTPRNILKPNRKRALSVGLKETTLNYLVNKNERAHEIRLREIELKEKEQTLNEKKFELESFERKKKLDMEEKKNGN